MKRGSWILTLGLAGAVIAYGWAYLTGTATPRAMLNHVQPELAWLQHEFNLSNTEFARISELHAGYLPQCKERCRHIEQLNGQLSQALANTAQVTPEIEKLLYERAQIRARCQIEMLEHFYAVSRTMPPDQGKRYLAWVLDNTCLREEPMDHGSDSEDHSPAGRPEHPH